MKNGLTIPWTNPAFAIESRLAQIYEKKGQTSEAATEYERFLKVWENADPGRPEIASARSRLEALRKPL